MGGKIYYQESRGKPFKAYVKKQDKYCLLHKNQGVLIVILKN